MYALLSPAKKMDFDRRRTGIEETQPLLKDQAQVLVKNLAKKSAEDLADLMHLSDKLAQLNYDRYQNFAKADQARAIEAFQGDTYVGFGEKDLDDKTLSYAQDHIGILSGLYGLLRPLDLIKPYRLEMGTKLATEAGEKLYDFWGDQITKAVNKNAKGAQAIIGLASNEYLSAVDLKKLDVPFIQCDFKETKDGKPKTIGLFAKRARGMMARFIVENRIEKTQDLKKFNAGDYKFNADLSDENTYVFVR